MDTSKKSMRRKASIFSKYVYKLVETHLLDGARKKIPRAKKCTGQNRQLIAVERSIFAGRRRYISAR